MSFEQMHYITKINHKIAQHMILSNKFKVKYINYQKLITLAISKFFDSFQIFFEIEKMILKT